MNKTKLMNRMHRAVESASRINDQAEALRIKVDAVHDVLTERRRQIDAEGRLPSDDARYIDGELTLAAVAYALFAPGDPCNSVAIWPFGATTFKPKSRRKNLVRAAALLIAEIERIDSSDDNDED